MRYRIQREEAEAQIKATEQISCVLSTFRTSSTRNCAHSSTRWGRRAATRALRKNPDTLEIALLKRHCMSCFEARRAGRRARGRMRTCGWSVTRYRDQREPPGRRCASKRRSSKKSLQDMHESRFATSTALQQHRRACGHPFRARECSRARIADDEPRSHVRVPPSSRSAPSCGGPRPGDRAPRRGECGAAASRRARTRAA